MEIKNKTFSIIGMARSGIAAAKKISGLGGKVFISDFKKAGEVENSTEVCQKFDCEFGGHTIKVLQADTIIVSPGVPLNIEILSEARQKGIELISEIEFGYRIKSEDSKLICCTGSNGKSTTVSLIHHILVTCGYKAVLAGNIGTPFTAFPVEKPGIDFIVLELSSFQLELINKFKADAAIILNITPDHLDRYDGFDHYAQTKFNIFRNQTAQDLAILNLDDNKVREFSWNISSRIKWFSREQKADAWKQKSNLIVNQQIFPISDLAISGPHNEMNTMAALLAIADYTSGMEDKVRAGLSSFQSLPHRLEYITSVNGVRFINDSKATNTDSVKYALLSFSGNVHIILGGSDKGEDFSILIPYLQKDTVHTYIIGATKNRMRDAFKNRIRFEECNGLEDAMRQAFSSAQKDDVILLSPACASYDSFRNYLHRGETFRNISKEIENEQTLR